MGFVWVNAFSFSHCVASPFHIFVTTCKRRNDPIHSYAPSHVKQVIAHIIVSHELRDAPSVSPSLCYTEKASPTRHRPERQHNARSNRRKQCSPNETIPYPKPKPPRKRQTTPTNDHTQRRMKPTHTRLTYTRMRPHAPSHQAGDHPVPAHTERHKPPRLRTQRQSGLPPRAACSQGQWHRCRSIRKQSV